MKTTILTIATALLLGGLLIASKAETKVSDTKSCEVDYAEVVETLKEKGLLLSVRHFSNAVVVDLLEDKKRIYVVMGDPAEVEMKAAGFVRASTCVDATRDYIIMNIWVNYGS